MDGLDLYMVVTIVFSIFMGCWWNSGSLLNVTIKTFYFAIALWGLVICFNLHLEDKLLYIKTEEAKIQVEKARLSALKTPVPLEVVEPERMK